MSKRKGLSLEEKREKVLEVFTSSGDVFVLKVCTAPGTGRQQTLAQRATGINKVGRADSCICASQLMPISGCRKAGFKEGCGLADHQGGVAGATP